MKKKLLLCKFACRHCILLLIFLFSLPSGYAQNASTKQVTLSKTNTSLVDILVEIQKQTGVNFVYEKQQLADFKPVTINVQNVPLGSVLDRIFEGTRYSYKIDGNNVAIIRAAPAQAGRDADVANGRVVDAKGNPLPGATVMIHGSHRGVVTDARGRFSIAAKEGDVLKINMLGYVQQLVLVQGAKDIEITLQQDAKNIEEVQVVAFGTQKAESVVSSITSVRPEQLRSSNSDLTASFAGNVAGMIAWQTGGIPGALTEEEMNTKFYIRGITSFQKDANIDPLILLDGVEVSKLDLARIDPEDIESFNVMKDATATAMYGARGANGVIYVTTKRGEAGSVYTSARYEVIASMPTREIEVVDAVSFMKLYNETLLQRSPLSTPKYTREQIENTGSDRYPYYVYPSNDWYDILFKNFSINHHMGVNIRGGSEIVKYYASLNYNQDNGMLKTDRLNQFKVNIKSQTTSFRINLNIDLTSAIKLVINSFSTLDKYHGPVANVQQAYAMAFGANQVDFAAVYPGDDYYNWNQIRFGGTSTSGNPYAEIQAGYTDRMRYSTINSAEYIQNLSFIVKGLEFRANASITQEGYFTTSFATGPGKYYLKHYDFVTGKHTLGAVYEGTRVLGSDPVRGSQYSTATTRVAYDLRLMHTAAWGGELKNKHQTSLTAVLATQETRYANPDKLFNSFPYRNLGLSARGTYGFLERYFVEASFGYNGSERFAKNHRMGFFPAVGAAWIVSKEKFMAGTEKWLPFFKIRLSYGKVGNDGVIKDPRFVHLSNIESATMGVYYPTGGMMLPYYEINNYKNPNITWEVAEQSNLGIDLKLFSDGPNNDLIEINADIYREIRHNILDNRYTIPASLGLIKPSLDNVGKVKSRGVDIAVKVQHAFNPDFYMIFNGTFTYNKATFLEIEEATNKPWYQSKVGKEISQQFGYIADGLFQDQDEIDNAPFQGGDVMPGDIRYRDLNGDGKIDVYDATAIGFPETPRIIYGFNGFLGLKGFEFSFSFQGSGNRSFFLNPEAISPLVGNRAVLKAIADDHWTTENAKNHPFWPRLSTNNIVVHNPEEKYNNTDAEQRKSTYFMRSGKFLRCRSIELGYNLPSHWVKQLGLRNIKIYGRVNNPFIIADFKIWDIELGNSGFNYPIQKTYSVGINVSF